MFFSKKELYEKYLDKIGVEPNSAYDSITRGGGLFSSEDIYTISMSSSKVFDEDQYESTRTRLIIDKAINNSSIKEYIFGFANVGDLQFSKYYIAGQNYYKDYLPKITLSSVGIPKDEIKTIIESIENIDIEIISNSYTYIYEEDWCKYQLQEKYNYSIVNDYLKFDNKYYEYNSYIYNYENKIYTVILNTINKIDKTTNKITKITITNKDETTDIKTTTIYLENIYTKSSNGKFLYSEIEESSYEEEIPKDSESSSETLEGLGTITEEIPSTSISFTIEDYNTFNKLYYVKYLVISENIIKYWIYDPITNIYPQLTNINPIKTFVDTEIYPVAIIRNKFNNITGDRLEKTSELLSSIGIDIDTLFKSIEDCGYPDKIQDSFLLFGVSPSEIDESVSKILYETIEYVYNILGEQNNNAYAISTNSDPYFNDILWTHVDTSIKEEKILETNSCKHENNLKAVYTYLYVTSQYLREEIISNKFSYYVFKINYIKEKITENNELVSREITSSEEYYIPKIFFDNGYNYASFYIYTTIEQSVGDNPPVETKHYVNVKLTKDNELNISDKYELDSYESLVTLIVTKQIDKTHTKTYTIGNFIGNYTIYHSQGTSVIGLNGANKELVIPIIIPVLNKLTLIEKTKLLDNSVYIHYYAFDHQHLSWYETGFFADLLKGIMICITIVVTIVTVGTGTSTTLELSAVVWNLLEKLVIAIGLSLALKTIITTVDNNFLKILLSATAIVAATYLSGGFDNFEFLDAVVLVNSTIDAYNIYLSDKIDLLNRDINAFNTKYESTLEKYDNIMESLNDYLSVEDITNILITNDDIVNSTIFNNNLFYYIATEMYKDFDLLYSLPETSVNNFVDKKLTLIGEYYE